MPSLGWQPVIYTPENPDFDLKDDTLSRDVPSEAEIVKHPIWEPYQVARQFGLLSKNQNAGMTGGNNPGWKTKVLNWVRGNVFIPDPRVYWVKPSISYLSTYLQSNPVDLIISTGPPHSMHMIALGLKKKGLSIPWVADFRDPFSMMDVYDRYNTSNRVRKRLAKIETEILENCTRLLATSFSLPEMLQDFDTHKMITITHGFETMGPAKTKVKETGVIRIFYAGTLNEVRYPKALFEAMNTIGLQKNGDPKIKLNIAGKVAPSIIKEIETNPTLNASVSLLGYLPHAALDAHYQSSDLLLLLVHNTKIARVCIPGKLFEYLGADTPILSLADPLSDSAKIIEETARGESFAYSDVEGVTHFLRENIDGKYQMQGTFADIEKYQREQLAVRLVKELNTLI